MPPSFRTRGLRRAKEKLISGRSPRYSAEFWSSLRGKWRHNRGSHKCHGLGNGSGGDPSLLVSAASRNELLRLRPVFPVLDLSQTTNKHEFTRTKIRSPAKTNSCPLVSIRGERFVNESLDPCHPCDPWSDFISAFPRRAFGKRDRSAKDPRMDRA